MLTLPTPSLDNGNVAGPDCPHAGHHSGHGKR
ncbi:MAG: hypothetical protein QOF57_2014, partial [Frankiaceae bacterium]|nr:hypothetical protein [Frankiaceae bacterium]